MIKSRSLLEHMVRKSLLLTVKSFLKHVTYNCHWIWSKLLTATPVITLGNEFLRGISRCRKSVTLQQHEKDGSAKRFKSNI